MSKSRQESPDPPPTLRDEILSQIALLNEQTRTDVDTVIEYVQGNGMPGLVLSGLQEYCQTLRAKTADQTLPKALQTLLDRCEALSTQEKTKVENAVRKVCKATAKNARTNLATLKALIEQAEFDDGDPIEEEDEDLAFFNHHEEAEENEEKPATHRVNDSQSDQEADPDREELMEDEPESVDEELPDIGPSNQKRVAKASSSKSTHASQKQRYNFADEHEVSEEDSVSMAARPKKKLPTQQDSLKKFHPVTKQTDIKKSVLKRDDSKNKGISRTSTPINAQPDAGPSGIPAKKRAIDTAGPSPSLATSKKQKLATPQSTKTVKPKERTFKGIVKLATTEEEKEQYASNERGGTITSTNEGLEMTTYKGSRMYTWLLTRDSPLAVGATKRSQIPHFTKQCDFTLADLQSNKAPFETLSKLQTFLGDMGGSKLQNRGDCAAKAYELAKWWFEQHQAHPNISSFVNRSKTKDN